MSPAIDELTDRFLLIGAGPAGLGMAWELRKRGLRFDQVEAKGEVGGVWIDGVYEGVRTISPRSLCSYPVRPMPATWPEYLSLGQVRTYLRDFAREEGLTEQIAFGVRVAQACPEPDEAWRVTFAHGRIARYRGVISCVGHTWDRAWPRYQGVFSGEIRHTGEYRHPSELTDRRVLVVGLGQSGSDLALDASRHAKCAHLSVRHGKYLLPRELDGRSCMELFPGKSSPQTQRDFVRRMWARHVPDAITLGLPPPALEPLEEMNLCWTDDLPDALRQGAVRLRPAVERADGRRIFFTDGSSDEYDLMICATGFRVSFPFLPPGFVPMTNEKTPRLFLGSVVPLFRHLYLTGSLEIIGGFGTAASLNAAIVCDLIETQERMKLPLGSVARWLRYPSHRTNTTSHGRAQQMRRIIPFWLFVARQAERLRRSVWLKRHRTEFTAWRSAQAAHHHAPPDRPVAPGAR